MAIRVLDMFCGAGGSSAGAREAGCEIVHAIDAWEIAALTFQDNFSATTVDTRTLTANDRPLLALDVGAIDMIIASPECTNS